METFTKIKEAYANYKTKVESMNQDIETITALYQSDPSKKNRGDKLRAQTSLNTFIRDTENTIAHMICEWMFQLETIKVNDQIPSELLDTVKEAFILLGNNGRLNTRYFKLPVDWLKIGAIGGIMEDFVVIMRTPNQIGIGDKHMFTIEEIITGFRTYLSTEKQTNGPRFIFMTYFFDNYTDIELKKMMLRCIQSQGASRRIGTYHADDTDYYYALQGIYGHIEYDSRVVSILTPKSFEDDKCPKIGVHFSQLKYVEAIRDKKPTTNNRSKGKAIPVGMIVRFDRVIHALSCVHYDEEATCFRINDEFVSIRDRMVNGLIEANRPKYQGGMVIDIPKLVSILPPRSVMINEIGTLLITSSVPHECLIGFIDTDDAIAQFWHLDK